LGASLRDIPEEGSVVCGRARLDSSVGLDNVFSISREEEAVCLVSLILLLAGVFAVTSSVVGTAISGFFSLLPIPNTKD
jgi:hypothetical protein